MPWIFKISGLWTWVSSKTKREMVQLSLCEGIEYKFWKLHFTDFDIYCKTHPNALKITQIIRSKLAEASDEIKANKLMIPNENMPLSLAIYAVRQYDDRIRQWAMSTPIDSDSKGGNDGI